MNIYFTLYSCVSEGHSLLFYYSDKNKQLFNMPEWIFGEISQYCVQVKGFLSVTVVTRTIFAFLIIFLESHFGNIS